MRKMIAAVALSVMAAGFAASASAETLTVGVYPANPPWEVKQPDGSFEGFEVDLVNAIAEKLGVDVDYQDTGFQALFAATNSGRIDMAISSITITNDRLQNQDFTQGYYDADLALGLKEGTGAATLADLEGKDVGVLSASTGDKWAREYGEQYKIGAIRGYDTNTQMLLDAQNGRVAAVVTDLPGMLFAFKEMKGMTTGETISTGDRYAIMLAKDSPWTQKASDAITELKEEGFLAQIHEKWFGVPPMEGTSTVTVLDIPTAE
ncbi:ABC transporter substrate-binding protein [Acuticoccus sp. MNP-M23]|uniref:ABC transporter substrate-binding protein n=1 Tax=Acuticoccus sp. MNP-M23 TaxID=3072793 RepID=UPI0028155F2A|nr:ABC transporter substrate-binding protein [Acuticoccus sp. MNP-M23]WMS42834.1 ABC transporter substrate-binding protein [Acuticoccus sp. MNP-M23]